MTKKKLIYGIGNSDGCVTKINGKHTDAYRTWIGMLQRCYGESDRNKSYIDTQVDKTWHSFKTFNVWFDNNYHEGYQLDKDILGDSKLYSENTCCFVPHRINNLITKHSHTNFHRRPNGKYRVRLNTHTSRIQIGEFDTESEAKSAYKQAKEEYIKKVAHEYYLNNLIVERVYNALNQWVIESDQV